MAPVDFYRHSFDDGDENALFGTWSWIHLLSGVTAGVVAYFILKNDPKLIDTLSLTWLFLVVAWEVFEYIGHRRSSNNTWWAFTYEHPLNKLTDVIVGLFGFVLTLYVSKVDMDDVDA